MELQKLETPLSTVLKSDDTPRAIGAFRAVFIRALSRAGLAQKQAAYEMEISESQLSRQLAGLEHLSLWRAFRLPPAFWYEFIVLLIDFYELTLGASEQDRRDLELGRELRAVVLRAGQR